MSTLEFIQAHAKALEEYQKLGFDQTTKLVSEFFLECPNMSANVNNIVAFMVSKKIAGIRG